MRDCGTVESTIKPAELEVTDTKVFVASNIEKLERDEITIYQYHLTEYTKNEYIFLLHSEQEEQNEVLDYLLMEE